MLIGVYLKNFKCYQGTKFIPCYSLNSGKFISYLGDNGVGKSAILEALNAFFSKNPHWYRNKDAKKGPSECFIAPVFLLEKNKIPDSLAENSKDIIKNLKITEISDSSVAVCLAKREDGLFTLFDGKKESPSELDQKNAKKLYEILINLYQFIYINAEVDIDKEAKVNSEIYEVIIGSSIVTEVEKKFKENAGKSKLIEALNQTLETLIDEKFTKSLKQIDVNYSYEGFRGARSKLTTNVLARVSTEAFLSSRKLKYKGKQLDDLSSGQRRTALLDFIFSVLNSKVLDKNKELIIAIDEPEISLDSSKKLIQFEKLVEIAKMGISVMITSHWYGWIAGTKLGCSILISDTESKEKDIKIYKNKEFPFKDIPKYEMRMVFDFLASLGANAEANADTRYIICEGDSDLLYLSASLNNDKYKIIPVGKKRVKKIADIFKDYYWKNAGPIIKNVIFIIDTDPENKDIFGNDYLKRWSKTNDLKFNLISNGENFHNKCIIENILESDILLSALKFVHGQKEPVKSLKIEHKDISGIDAYGMDAVKLRQFYKITEDSKVLVANKYKELLLTSKKTTNLIKTLIEKTF